MSDKSFGAFVPGFDFLQGLVKNAGAAMPGFSQWVAPTLNPQELDKRIQELRAVQFWLEQNARMLATTVQALEVQKMTLSTLHAMNVPMKDLQQALKMPPMPDLGAAMGAMRSAAEAAGARWNAATGMGGRGHVRRRQCGSGQHGFTIERGSWVRIGLGPSGDTPQNGVWLAGHAGLHPVRIAVRRTGTRGGAGRCRTACGNGSGLGRRRSCDGR